MEGRVRSVLPLPAAQASAWAGVRGRGIQLLVVGRLPPQFAYDLPAGRKLQNLGGMVHKKGLVPAPMPSWCTPLLARLASEGVYGGQLPNHVLVNAYQPGEGILPHEDGPLYYPAVAILSLAAPAVVRFVRKRSAAEAHAGGCCPCVRPWHRPGCVVHCTCMHGWICVHHLGTVGERTDPAGSWGPCAMQLRHWPWWAKNRTNSAISW